ncbi:MAG: XRE family transcriptional regulator [Bacteroidales bacterium]|nr:XRE family transcriptional regulator [Bacteroidales bacterium]
MNEDIGELIRLAMEEAERKPQWLARKIDCDRSNIYDIFRRKDVSVEMLCRISKVLKKNLLKDISLHLDEEIADEKCKASGKLDD